ncbi:helix-turn-helix domain-containing protein [Actinomadura decatromicini]|uniref:Helix-turn-helix transcriptional regulator n=1 Tax=Actinomadura decatromicini TaxID=2604572 RepID=A0A5D3FXC6_9ACTN|nr:helix-turn-helix transcriptional regulator [Actinomadura decatromicini]TYK52340.1 helix-turn-helix transcriptional regulator [Actinomadura decatromicini]
MEAHNISEALKMILEGRGWTQGRLGSELDMDQPTVSRLISGKRDLKINHAAALLARVGWKIRITPESEESDPVKRREFIIAAASVTLIPTPTSSPYKDSTYVQMLANRLSTSELQFGGSPLVSTALRHVRNVKGAITSRDRALQQAASNLARSASLILYDARLPREAEEVGSVGLTLARRANHVEGVAHSLENLCCFTTSVDSQKAAHYARRGLLLEEITSEHRARLNARLAVALGWHARTSSFSISESLSAMDTARELDGLSPITKGVIAGNAGLSFARIRNYDRANSAFDAAVRRFEDLPLLAATWRGSQVLASLRAGQVSQAANQMEDLASIVPLVTSARSDRNVRQILTYANQWHRVPEMREAIGHLRSVATPAPRRT